MVTIGATVGQVGSGAGSQALTQLMDGLRPDATLLSSTARTLAWVTSGYLVWMPALFLSQRARTTFATHERSDIDLALDDIGFRTVASARELDVEAITKPPGRRGHP